MSVELISEQSRVLVENEAGKDGMTVNEWLETMARRYVLTRRNRTRLPLVFAVDYLDPALWIERSFPKINRARRYATKCSSPTLGFFVVVPS